jgi:hypothetical protein
MGDYSWVSAFEVGLDKTAEFEAKLELERKRSADLEAKLKTVQARRDELQDAIDILAEDTDVTYTAAWGDLLDKGIQLTSDQGRPRCGYCKMAPHPGSCQALVTYPIPFLNE